MHRNVSHCAPFLHFWLPHPRAILALLLLCGHVDHVVKQDRLQFIITFTHTHQWLTLRAPSHVEHAHTTRHLRECWRVNARVLHARELRSVRCVCCSGCITAAAGAPLPHHCTKKLLTQMHTPPEYEYDPETSTRPTFPSGPRTVDSASCEWRFSNRYCPPISQKRTAEDS